MKIELKGMKQAIKSLQKIDKTTANAAYRAINKVAAKTRTKASKAIRAEVKLTATYLNSPDRFVLIPATKDKLNATIKARVRPTRLATYGAKQLTKKAGPRSQGDTVRGIAAGRKSAGVSVNVGKQRKKMPGAFLIPLSNGNGMGVFIRTGTGKKDIKQLYGPSISQIFKTLMPKITQGIDAELAETFNKQFAYEQSR